MPKKRPIDLAREFNEKTRESFLQRSAPFPLAGIDQDACERNVYLRLNGGETPARLFRAVLAHWKELLQTYGGQISGIGNMRSLIVVPTGEVFCNFRMASFPVLVGETEADTIPKVERSVELFHEFAGKTGRLTGAVRDEVFFVCSDGRRWALTECECCILMSKEIEKKFKPTKP